MTEQLAKDVEILDTTEKSGRDLAAILGLDIDDKSFVLQMTPFYGNDTKSISSGGGITVKPNQQITIEPQITESILYLKTMAIFGHFLSGTIGDIPVNSVALFQSMNFKFVNFGKAFTSMGPFLQQKIELMSSNMAKSKAKGYWMGFVDDDLILQTPAVFATATAYAQSAGTAGTPVTPQSIYSAAHFNVGNVPDGSNSGLAGSIYNQGYQVLYNNYCASSSINGDRNFCVYLCDLFPDLFESIGWLLYVDYPGQVQFSIQTNPTAECIICPQNVAGNVVANVKPAVDYNISNMFVFFQYTQLAQLKIQKDAILQTEIEYRPKYVLVAQQAFQVSNSLSWTASRNQKVHELYIGVHGNGVRGGNGAITSAASLYNSAHYLLGYCIMFISTKLQQMQLNASGDVKTLNMSDLAMIQLQQSGQNYGMTCPEESGQQCGNHWRFCRCPLAYDLSRCGLDLIGSSNNTIDQLTAVLQWNLNEDLSIYGNFATIANPKPSPIDTISSTYYTTYGYLTVSSRMIMKKGQYYEPFK